MVLDCVKEVYSQVVRDVLPSYTMPNVSTDLRGGCAGTAYPSINKIRINLEIYSEIELRETVIHEVAHIVGRIKYRAKGHDGLWRKTVLEMGGTPERCHSMKFTAARKVQKKFEYACGCKTRKITAIKHNRILRGWTYRCCLCGEPIRHCG